jgi:hypothetical protein
MIKYFLFISILLSCNPFGKGTKVQFDDDASTATNSDNQNNESTGGQNNLTAFGDGADGDETLTGGSRFVTSAMPSSSKIWSAEKPVSSISADGLTFTIPAPPFNSDQFDTGDELMWHVTQADSSTSCATDGGLTVGTYGTANIVSTAGGNSITIDSAVNTTVVNGNLTSGLTFGDTNFCRIIVRRIPNFDNLTVTADTDLKSSGMNFVSPTGGTIILRVKDTLSIAAGQTLNLFVHGLVAMPAHNGSGDVNSQGPSHNGLGIATCNTSGCGTELANGSGGGRGFVNAGNYNNGGGGGANFGQGGNGAYLTGSTDYGRGGNSLACGSSSCLFMGGAGGTGASTVHNGAGGGSVIVIYAKNIEGDLNIQADGESAANGNTGRGGGGAGGHILLEVRDIGTGTITLDNIGGDGANSTDKYAGGGGSGGVTNFRYCSGSATITSDVTGGAGGTSVGASAVDAEDGDDGSSTISLDATFDFCPL